MGDRANVVIRDEWPDQGDNEAVFLYSHWGGHYLPDTLREALASEAGKDRWTDDPYLARIVFNRMTANSPDAATGFGISTRLCDNEYPLLVLNKGRVYVMPENEYATNGFANLAQQPSISYEDYIKHEQSWETIEAEAKVQEVTT